MVSEESEVVKVLRKCFRGDQYTRYGILLANALGRAKAHCQKDPERPSPVVGFEATIPTTDDRPIVARPRKLNEVQRVFLKQKIRQMRRRGQLEDATGEYSSALVLVPYHDRIKAFTDRYGDRALEEMAKPEHEKEVCTFYRLTQDLRDLNNKTIADLYPLPRIDYLLDQVKKGTSHFSIGDLHDAFWCVPLAKEDRHKTAFRTPYDHVQSTVMVQGAKNSANKWARIAAHAFSSMATDEAIVYQDDVLGHSLTFEEHYRTLNKVYDCLENMGLTLKLAKCHFDYPEIEFLGHFLDKDGKYPSRKAVEAILDLAYPCNDQTEVRSFVGMTLYYKQYIKDYASIVAPLHDLTRKGVDVKAKWGKEHEEAVDKLKEMLTQAPCLMPIDNAKPFQIRCDACRRGRGLGAILLQPVDDAMTVWAPVAYWSKLLRGPERDYAPVELECKCLHDCILHWDVYLQNARLFTVYTDHNALTYMVKGQTATNNGRLMRYLMDLMGYNMELYYKDGKYHVDADAVSRLFRRGETPVYSTADDLEDDKGVPTEEEVMWVKDQEVKKNRRMAKAMERKKAKAEEEQQRIIDEVIRGPDVCIDEEGNERRPLPEGEMAQKRRRELVSCAIKTRMKVEGEEAATVAPGWAKRLRQRVRSGAYDERRATQAYRDDTDTAPLSEVEEELVRLKRPGYSRLRVLESTIPKAGWGLFTRRVIERGSQICSYGGHRVTAEQRADPDYDTTYVFSYWTAKGEEVWVDAKDAYCSYGRYANDPRDEAKTNAKIVRRGNRIILVATAEILPGEEILIDYGYEYWLDKLGTLTPLQAEEVRQEEERRQRRSKEGGQEVPPVEEDIQPSEQGKVAAEESSPPRPKVPILVEGESEPSLREAARSGDDRRRLAEKVRRAADKQDERRLDRYVFDGVLQCHELAEELQYLVGKKYIDDENGVLYQVDRVLFSESARAVVGYRKAVDGRIYAYDDDPFHVYGSMGILQLTELYEVDQEGEQVSWPQNSADWSVLQEADSSLRDIRAKGRTTGGQEWTEGTDTFRMFKIEGEDVLFRKNLLKDRLVWQKMVPESLQGRVMKMFHEGHGHPNGRRALETMRLHYYWEDHRAQFMDHCRDCISCQLRNAYTRRPKVPVQEYPEVLAAMGRVHMDLTGPLVTTKDGHEYILVVKDFKTKFVWLFPLRNKDAEGIADILVSEIFCQWGAPDMLVSDRGREFTNRLNKRISRLFRVNRISTTPYNPRANGLVEQHNGTLKSQLYHFVDVKQDDWDVFLPTVQLMYNSTVNSSTGYTPNYMMYGREFHIPDVVLPLDEPSGDVDADEDWVDRLTDTLGKAWSVVMKQDTSTKISEGVVATEVNAESNRVKLRSRIPHYTEYKVGDKFFRKRNPVRSFRSVTEKRRYKLTAKLQARFDGPYIVKERVNAVVYVANIGGEDIRIHAVNMKPAH